MGRWEPDARGRLLRAAMELFADRGYEATTAAQIAEHADLTKTTLFRHFSDKREIIFQGQQTLVALATGGVETAPDGSSATELLQAGVLALCRVHGPEQRDIGRRLDPILAASPELQERAVFKRFAITSALHQALTARLADARGAGVLADVGMRAYYDGFAAWTGSDDDETLASVVSGELAAYWPAVVDLVLETSHTAPSA